MASTEKVAVVTGGYKGIGFMIVKGLCEKYNGKVYFTARDESRAGAAVSKMKEFGLNPVFHQLDINDQRSIHEFRDHIKEVDGGIDILINNAEIAYPDQCAVSFSEQAEVTVQVNYFSTLNLCMALFPLLRPNAQVINISSAMGLLSKIPSPELRLKFSKSDLSVEQLNELMKQFILAAKDDKHIELGWGNSAYAVSKVGLNALTQILQREVDNEFEKRGIAVNSVNPVADDMIIRKESMSIIENITAPLYLALEPHELRGKFVWHDLKVVDWSLSLIPSLS